MKKHTPVIGLEIHVELKTMSKMFCQCSADYFGKPPNSNTCPVCLGLPGALPVPNKQAVEWTIKIGQALNCKINKQSKFDRKHYFYPDLPKAYQISQYDEPIAVGGYLEIRTLKHPPASPPPSREEFNNSPLEGRGPEGGGVSKRFRITRVHLEEDTGKLMHTGDDTLVDFNRSSVPLVEIVTEPDFDNAEDVKVFLEELHTIIRYLDVSDANMEEGSMRMEPNISLMKVHPPSRSARHPLPKGGSQEVSLREGSLPAGQAGTPQGGGMLRELPDYKVEVKNINSFNFAKRAIEYELKRQAMILDDGKTPAQETRGYDEKKGITYSQRTKEGAADYRYFPEPDIPPMTFNDDELTAIKKDLPELPAAKVKRYVQKFGLKFDDAFILTRDKGFAEYFETVMKHLKGKTSAQVIANVIVNKRIPTTIPAAGFAKRLQELQKPVVVDEKKLEETIVSVIQNNPAQVEQYKKGKTNIIMFFVGQVMKEMKGKADAQAVMNKIKKRLA